MKKRILSILLCTAMLIGLLPASIIPAAAAPEVGAVNNIVVRTEDNGNITIRFDGVPTAVKYVVSETASSSYNTITVKDETQNAGTFSVVIGKSEFYSFGTGRQSAPSGRARVQAVNMYGETIADGYSEYFKNPYDGYIDCIATRRAYLSPTGIFYFEPIDGVNYYTIRCDFNNKHMMTKSATSQTFMDISSFAREGDYYTFVVDAYPVGDKLLPSTVDVKLKYSGETPLEGEAIVNSDKSVTYGHYLGYLHTHTDTALTQQWQRYDPMIENYDDAWVNITQAEKANYKANQLRVIVSAAGHPGTVTSSDNLYNSPADAYIATDYKELITVFNRRHDPGTTKYIKLGADITAPNPSSSLEASGGDVELDLCGHTLSYKGSNKKFITSEYGGSNRVTIRDSRRYDSAKKQWIDGVVSFNHNQFRYHNGGSTPYASGDYLEYCGLTTTVLAGNITVYGGIFINESHKSYETAPKKESGELRERVYGYQTGYGYNDGLRMYGGTFEAQKPIELQAGYYNKGEFGIYGGTINVTGQVAIDVRDAYGNNDLAFNFPVIRACKIVNMSGNTQAIAMSFSHQNSDTSAKAYEKFGKFFLSATVSYIDGVKQSKVTDGTYYDGIKTVMGPLFKDTFELKTETSLKNLEFQITEPESGSLPDNTVTGAESDLYDFQLTWQYERTPNTFRDMDPDSYFRTGLYYRAKVEIKPKDGVTITSLTGTNTIGSHVADVSGLTLYANYYLKDTYFNIYIGGTRVGRKNKGDVLGDGGSVQFFEKGEYPDPFFANGNVLVFNNFNMIKNDYSHYENEYYGNGCAHIVIEEDLNVIVHGENSLGGYYSTVNGICIGTRDYVSFFGDGKLTVDETYCDCDALIGFGSSVSFHDDLEVVLKGRYGARLEFDGDTADFDLWDNANVTCRAYQTEDDKDYPALKVGGSMLINNHAQLICIQQDNEDAMFTWGDDFPTAYYDIKILKKGEFANSQTNPVTPYEPAVGLNCTGGVYESECRYISIKGKTVYATELWFNPDTISLTPANTSRKVTAGFLPMAAASLYDDLTWESSDETVVSVTKESNRTATVTGLKNGTATVTATAPGGATGTLTVTVSGFSDVVNEITSVEIIVDDPVAGDLPSFAAAVPNGSAYKVDDFNNEYFKHGVSWNYGDETSSNAILNNNLPVFNAGDTYTVIVTLVPKDPSANVFADGSNITATVNGEKATVSAFASRAFVLRSFTVPQGDTCDVFWYLSSKDTEPAAGVEVKRGEVFGNPPEPNREGYDFAGWYKDRALTVPYDPKAPITEDTDLFARWEPKDDDCPGKVFTDMPPKGHWAHNAIDWAIVNKITAGTSATTFSPNNTCTRGQVVTFLWRAMGSPEPTGSDNPFTDVRESDYFYEAVIWANEKGITNGTSETTFSPNAGCTRGHVVTFLWRAEGQPSCSTGNNPFTDVKSGAYYYDAVMWAVENEITNGTSKTTFSPDTTCTRSQIVTFIYRDMAS